jgi:hypothetical protein
MSPHTVEAGTPAPRSVSRPFSITTVQGDTNSRLLEVRNRLETLASRILGALPPPTNSPDNTDKIAPDNLTSRFRENDISMNRAIDRMNDFLTALEEQL